MFSAIVSKNGSLAFLMLYGLINPRCIAVDGLVLPKLFPIILHVFYGYFF